MVKINELGEFGLIERFKKSIKLDSTVIKGPGDDCAVINPALSSIKNKLGVGKGGVKSNQDKYLLFTCDMLVEGVDFLKTDKPSLIGRKALAISISDIAACGGIPRYSLISMGMHRRTSLERVDKISRGIFDLARRFKINIVGGDLSEASQLVIDVSMLGVVEKECLVLRSGARKGDMIFVTGSLGGAIFGKHLKFTPRLKETRFLVKNFKVNAMIDISDGLAQDLKHMLKESNVGAIIYADLIPLSQKARDLNDALYSGEDFELLFTTTHQEAKKILKHNPWHFKIVGEITEAKYGLRLVDKQGKEKIISAKGFRHF